MPTTLLIVYRVLGTVLLHWPQPPLWKNTARSAGPCCCCPRAGMPPCVIHQQQPGAGGYRYLVELYANGRRLELETNDAFWFRHDKDKGKVLQVWYNPNARCVAQSWETEFCGGAGRDRRGAAADPVRCL